jgi:sodium/proline symporter
VPALVVLSYLVAVALRYIHPLRHVTGDTDDLDLGKGQTLMGVVLSFCLCVAAFAAVGIASLRQSKQTSEDYLVAGRNVSGWLAALSSAATNNSGFMFVGLLGFTYRFGVQAVWLQAGWLLGDLVAWLWVYPRVCRRSLDLQLTSASQLVSRNDAGHDDPIVARCAAVLTLLFLSGYAGAQLKAGSAALVGAFGWDERVGVCLGGALVVAYCFSGGLRASIWTDAVQAIVMLVSIVILLATAMWAVGGPAEMMGALAQMDPNLTRWVPPDLRFGLTLYLLGFIAGGFGAVGQPHVLVRSMAMRSPAEFPHARRIYFAWYLPFSLAAVGIGLYARVLLPDLLTGVAPADVGHAAEQTLPLLATRMLPDFWLGVLLAGVFAATMSTADSQVLACSAALTQDIAPRYRRSHLASKSATLCITAIAVAIALTATEDVFELVLGAWSALGVTLGPLVLVRIFGGSLTTRTAVSMMVIGLTTELAWAHVGWSESVFELLPGLVAPLLWYLMCEPWRRRRWSRPPKTLDAGALPSELEDR